MFKFEVPIENIDRDLQKKLKQLANLLKNRVEIKIDKNKVVVSSEEYFDLMKAIKSIDAVTLGFDVKDSAKILLEDYELREIDIKEFSGKSYSHLKRLKGRVIGKEGKAKQYIENVTGAKILVKDRRIYILGEYEEVEIAENSIRKLLRGSTHSKVYRWMESQQKDLKRRRMIEF